MKRIKIFIGSICQNYNDEIVVLLGILTGFIIFVLPIILLMWHEMLTKSDSAFALSPWIVQLILCVIISFFKYIIGLMLLIGFGLCGFWLFRVLYEIYDIVRYYPYKKNVKACYFNIIGFFKGIMSFFKNLKKLWKEAGMKNEKEIEK